MSFPILGLESAPVVASVAAGQGAVAQMVASTSVAAAGGASVAPPGAEGASALATAQGQAGSAAYAAVLQQGLGQISGWLASIGASTTALDAVAASGAPMIAAASAV